MGTKQVAAHFPADVAWQLRALAVERKTTVQNLMAEALNDLSAKYGKPEVAPIERDHRAS
ncbi:MAG: ribbon-helix-helix domain-containing protein [Acetobacteraceae bacterium]